MTDQVIKSYLKTDVANSNRHQRRDEIYIIFTRTSRKLAKLFTRSLCHAIRPHLTLANLTQSCAISMRLLQMRARVSYSIRLTEFSCEQLCWSPGCAGKNNLDFVQSLVAFGISHISSSPFVWASQEFSARNCEMVIARGLSIRSAEPLRPRQIFAHSAFALALRAHSWVYRTESSLWQRLVYKCKIHSEFHTNNIWKRYIQTSSLHVC